MLPTLIPIASARTQYFPDSSGPTFPPQETTRSDTADRDGDDDVTSQAPGASPQPSQAQWSETLSDRYPKQNVWPQRFELTPFFHEDLDGVGVVKWENYYPPFRNFLDAQPIQRKQYTDGFRRAITGIAGQLINGKLNSAEQIWDACRAARVELIPSDIENQEALRKSFASDRQQTRSNLRTPMSCNYLDFYVSHRRLAPWVKNCTEAIRLEPALTKSAFENDCSEIKWHEIAQFAADHAKPNQHFVRVFLCAEKPTSAATVQIGWHQGKPIPLTTWFRDDNAGTWLYHTTPTHIDLAKPVIASKFFELFELLHQQDPVIPGAFRGKLASLNWWLANTCTDERGSAAKTEMFCRAVALASGFEYPKYKEGISSDVECMALSEHDWIDAQPYLLAGAINPFTAYPRTQST